MLTPQPLAVYIHWPFCKSKCPYCDFNSHVREGVDEAAWSAAMRRELAHMAQLAGKNREVRSVFFGGGTPSLMPPALVAQLLGDLSAHWRMAPDVEITLEANPTSSEAAKFKAFRAAGVNRLSLGVQSLRDADLRFLGREHSAAEALRAVEMARAIFPRHSFDLIYALPNQTLAQWEAQLREALEYMNGHLSLYQLTIEQGTAFAHQHKRGDFALPPDEEAVTFYERTGEILSEHGLQAYEISNYAKAGDESRHNLAYWQGGDYIGFGAGAHGRVQVLGDEGTLTPHATATLKSPERWLSQVQAQGHGLETCEALSQTDRAEEWILSGLRLASGIDKAAFQQRIGQPLASFLDPQGLRRMIAQNMAQENSTHLSLTLQGRLLLDSVLVELL